MFTATLFLKNRKDPISFENIVNSSFFNANDSYEVLVHEDGRRLYFKRDSIDAAVFNPNAQTPVKEEMSINDDNSEAEE